MLAVLIAGAAAAFALAQAPAGPPAARRRAAVHGELRRVPWSGRRRRPGRQPDARPIPPRVNGSGARGDRPARHSEHGRCPRAISPKRRRRRSCSSFAPAPAAPPRMREMPRQDAPCSPARAIAPVVIASTALAPARDPTSAKSDGCGTQRTSRRRSSIRMPSSSRATVSCAPSRAMARRSPGRLLNQDIFTRAAHRLEGAAALADARRPEGAHIHRQVPDAVVPRKADSRRGDRSAQLSRFASRRRCAVNGTKRCALIVLACSSRLPRCLARR